ncbi:MAG: SH3 domain-containing protein [Anaerolineae bacterium]|nr:SH3 domain-containing protein [Anaerolineae bacterium]
MTFSPDGQWLAIQEENNVQIWHIATDTWEEVVRIPNEVMKFSPDGRWLAVATLGDSVATVQVWLLQMPWQQPFQTLTQQTEGVYYVPLLSFSPDGQWVMLATKQSELEGQVTIWEIVTGEPKLNSSESVYDAAFSPDSQWVVWANYWADATVWKVGVWTEPQILKGLSFEFSSDNRWLATYEQWIVESGSNATLSVWDMKTWETIMNTPLEIHVEDMTLTPEGNKLIISGRCLEGENCYNRVSVIEVETWKEKGQLLERAWADYSGDGRWMATIEGNVVQIWDIGLKQRETALTNAELSYHDGQWLDIDDSDVPDDIWETVETDQVFSPDGKWLAQIDNRNVYLREAETLKELLRLPHRWPVKTLAFSSNGIWLVTGSSEDVAQSWIHAGKKEIRVWDLVTGREIERIELEGSDVNMEVAFSPNNQYIIYRSEDGLSEGIWTLQREDLILEACQRLPRNITLEEWQYYLGDEVYRKTCSNLPYHPSVIQHQIEQAETFVTEGNIMSATVTYESIVQAISEIYVYDYQYPVAEMACRSGASYGFAELVLPACDHAIELLVSNSFLHSSSAVNYHNARGLTRALSGDLDGAIQDFEFVVAKWEEQSACVSSTNNQCSKWQDLIKVWSTGQHLNKEEILGFLGYYDVLVDSPEFKLPLRQGPAVNYPKLSQLPHRTGLKSLETPEVTQGKIGQVGQWLYVRTFYGEEGYVAAWYLRSPYETLDEMPPEKLDEVWEGTKQLVQVASPDEPLRLRQGPSSDYPLLGYLAHAMILESLESPTETRSKVGQLDQWLHVRTPDGQEGYVLAWYLCPLEQ